MNSIRATRRPARFPHKTTMHAPVQAVRPALPPVAISLSAMGLFLWFCLPYLLPSAPEPIPSFDGEWLAAALGLVAFGLTAAAAPRTMGRIPGVAIVPIALAILVAAQMLLGRVAHPQLALLACLVLLWATLMIWLGGALRQRSDFPGIGDALAIALAAGAVVNAVVAIAQAHGVAGMVPDLMLPMDRTRPGGNLGQPNHLALQALWGLASLAALHARHGAGRWVLAASLPVIYALVLTASRAGALAACLLLAFGWIVAVRLETRQRRRLRVAVVAGGVLMLSAQAFLWSAPSGVLGGVGPRFAIHESQGDARPALWLGAWRMFTEAPLAGVGQGRFAGRLFELAPDLPAGDKDAMANHAHDLPLQVAAEFGLAGLAVFVVGGIVWWRAVRRQRLDPTMAWLLAIAMTAGVFSLFEYPLWYAYFLGPVAFVLGAAEGPRLEFRARRAVALLFAAAGIVGVMSLSSLWRDFGFLRSFQDNTQWAQAAPEEARERLAALSRDSLLASYVDVGLHRGLDLSADRLDAKLAFSAIVMRATPLPDVAGRHAYLATLAGRDAEAAWRRVETSYPQAASEWRRRAAQVTPPADAGRPSLAATLGEIH